MKRGYSIRTTLVLGLVATFSLLVLASGWISYKEARIESNELFDAKLAHSARLLRALSAHGYTQLDSGAQARVPQVVDLWRSATPMQGRGDALITAAGHAYETKLAFQVWSPQGDLLVRSNNAPESPISPLAQGFQTVHYQGSRWRCFTLESPAERWYQTCEDRSIRGELAREIALGVAIPALVAIPLAGLLVWWFVGWACRGLQRVEHEVSLRTPQRLQPLDEQAVPREIAALVTAINSLMAQVHGAIAREQRFTSEAAHEMRTPLAAVKLHAQNLLRAPSTPEAQHSCAHLQAAVERTERLVTQMLELARADPLQAGQFTQRLDLAVCVQRHLVWFLEAHPDAAARVQFENETVSNAWVQADDTLVGVLLRNLLENALRYSEGMVQVQLRKDAEAVVLSVIDQGPGIPEALRERVFERFFRPSGQAAPGSGLGLTIVKQIALLHDATLRLLHPISGGLQVEVAFTG